METKLTVSIDQSVLKAAKEYAEAKGRSLPQLIESYLKSIVEKSSGQVSDEFEISPLVQSLWGSVESLPENAVDHKSVLVEELSKKYAS